MLNSNSPAQNFSSSYAPRIWSAVCSAFAENPRLLQATLPSSSQHTVHYLLCVTEIASLMQELAEGLGEEEEEQQQQQGQPAAAAAVWRACYISRQVPAPQLGPVALKAASGGDSRLASSCCCVLLYYIGGTGVPG
jgi:hypothetical protein